MEAQAFHKYLLPTISRPMGVDMQLTKPGSSAWSSAVAAVGEAVAAGAGPSPLAAATWPRLWHCCHRAAAHCAAPWKACRLVNCWACQATRRQGRASAAICTGGRHDGIHACIARGKKAWSREFQVAADVLRGMCLAAWRPLKTVNPIIGLS